MKVVLAEKPSVARDLARILGAKTRREGWLEGNDYQVTWAVGHLVELADSRDYGFPRWDLAHLPILPENFKTKVTSDKGRARQFHIVAGLLRDAEEVICATDAGREGELIFRYIYELSGSKAPVRRLWISSYTDKAIKEGFDKMKSGADYEPLYKAARCRSEADWLVGINATQAYTLRFRNRPPFFEPGKKSPPISLGRVQTPVLKLLVERHEAVQAFVPETYWELILIVEKGEDHFQAKWFDAEGERFSEEEKGKAILEKIGETVRVASADKKPKSERPPQLYDLTELQKDANKRYNFSAQKTLDLAQDLYEKYKTLTYPRTDSRYLSSDLWPGIPGLLDNLSRVEAYAPFVAQAQQIGLQEDKRFFDDKKVSDHHAIIPTETNPASSGMPKEHFMIYDLVVRRFIGAFLGNCEKELSEIVLEDAGEQFKAKGTMIRENGWRIVYQALDRALEKRKEKAGKKTKAKEEETELPYVEVGEVLAVKEKDLPKKRTKAPAIHTESSILAMMETAGKEMEDENLREAMKERGLGTPATRAGMIERLLQRGYIVRDKKKLIPTERGIALIKLVGDRPIASPDLTGEWEFRLNQMARKEYASDQFMQEVRNYTAEIVAEAKGEPLRKVVRLSMPDYEIEAKCPKCGQGDMLRGRKAYGCARFREGCDFVLSPLVAGKLLSKAEMEALLSRGITESFVQGLHNRDGKSFDARIRLTPDFRTAFWFQKTDPEDLLISQDAASDPS